MNVEELKRRFAEHCMVKELDTRDGYAVEWTVAAMINSKEDGDIENNLKAELQYLLGNVFYPTHNIFPSLLRLFSKYAIQREAATQPDKSNEAIDGKGSENWQQELIGRVNDRFTELADYNFQWCSFYHGWLEGRFDMKKAINQPIDKINEAGLLELLKKVGESGYTKHQVNDRWYDKGDNYIGDTAFIYKLFSPNEAGERK